MTETELTEWGDSVPAWLCTALEEPPAWQAGPW